VRLADAAALRSQSLISGTTDAQRNNSINQEPDVVTIKGLNYWKIENRVVTARPGVQFIYVDPVNGRNITDINTLLAAPPITETGADASANRQAVAVRSLSAAADFANQAYGPATTVEFRCGPGVYLDAGLITFTTVATIRAWNFATNSYLNNAKNLGAVPFVTDNFRDPTKQPVFLTRPSANRSINVVSTTSQALTLRFEQAGTVIGCVWWGIMDTIVQAAVPDSFFFSTDFITAANSNNAANWRALAKLDLDNALNYFIREHAVKAGVSGRFFGNRITPCMQFLNGGRIANVSIGALSAADFAMSTDIRENEAVIQGSDKELTVSGLRLVGNCNISSAVNTGAFNIIRYARPGPSYTVSSYQYTGWAVAVFGPVAGSSVDLCLRFGVEGPLFGDENSSTSVNYNQTWNNLHLVNNSLNLASSTADPTGAGWKTIGPAVEYVIGQAKSVISSINRSWTQFNLATNGSPGFAGIFGRFNSVNAGIIRPTGILRPRNLARLGADTAGIFRVAGAGTLPTVTLTGINPGEVGAFVNFDALNVRVRGFKRGIDTVNAFTNDEDLVL
jgi:hypothetical protein